MPNKSVEHHSHGTRARVPYQLHLCFSHVTSWKLNGVLVKHQFCKPSRTLHAKKVNHLDRLAEIPRQFHAATAQNYGAMEPNLYFFLCFRIT